MLIREIGERWKKKKNVINIQRLKIKEGKSKKKYKNGCNKARVSYFCPEFSLSIEFALNEGCGKRETWIKGRMLQVGGWMEYQNMLISSQRSGNEFLTGELVRFTRLLYMHTYSAINITWIYHFIYNVWAKLPLLIIWNTRKQQHATRRSSSSSSSIHPLYKCIFKFYAKSRPSILIRLSYWYRRL